MSSTRRAVGGFLAAAALLVIGRAIVDWTAAGWFAEAAGVASGASGRRALALALRLVSGSTMTLAVFASLLAVRRSIVSVVVPRQFGNLVIGEVVPSGILTLGALLVGLVAGGSAAALPPDVLTVQLGLHPLVTGEVDPYWGRDLGFYWAWLPFEHWIAGQVGVIWLTVTLLTAFAYVLTPSVRMSRAGLRLAPWARRHLGLLLAFGVLLMGWRWRLERFDLLVADGEAFGLVAHRVQGPALALLAWAAWPLAALLAIAAWHARVGLAGAVAIVLLVAGPVVQWLLPLSAGRQLAASERTARDASYRAAAARYGARQLEDSTRLFLASQPVGDGIVGPASSPTMDSPLVDVGAGRYALVEDSTISAVGPRFEGLPRRVVLAWAVRAPGLLRRDVAAGARIVAPRDPLERLQRIAPFLEPLGGARWLSDSFPGPRWAIDVVATAQRFPMVGAITLGQGEARYARRAGVAYVDARTGGVSIAWTSAPDPLLRAWLALDPALLRGPIALSVAEARLWAGASAGPGASTAVTDREAALRAVYDTLVAARRRGDGRAALEAEGRLGRLLGAVR